MNIGSGIFFNFLVILCWFIYSLVCPPPIPKPLGLALRSLIIACLNCYFKWRHPKTLLSQLLRSVSSQWFSFWSFSAASIKSVAPVFVLSFFFLNYFLAISATKSVVNLSYTNNETDFCIVLFFTENDTRTLSWFTGGDFFCSVFFLFLFFSPIINPQKSPHKAALSGQYVNMYHHDCASHNVCSSTPRWPSTTTSGG